MAWSPWLAREARYLGAHLFHQFVPMLPCSCVCRWRNLAIRSHALFILSRSFGRPSKTAPMRFVLGSHASGFQAHIFASVPSAQYSRCRVLIEGTHAESAFRPGLRT